MKIIKIRTKNRRILRVSRIIVKSRIIRKVSSSLWLRRVRRVHLARSHLHQNQVPPARVQKLSSKFPTSQVIRAEMRTRRLRLCSRMQRTLNLKVRRLWQHPNRPKLPNIIFIISKVHNRRKKVMMTMKVI